MGFYPIFVDLRGRACVVVGGGAIAERKVDGLRDAGASVTVVAPTVTPALAALARAGEIRHVCRAYQPGDLTGAHLAIAAVPDPAVSGMVLAEARRRRIWLNAADDPERCDFILPAVVRRGSLCLAVATGGASPALSRVVRDWLDTELPGELATIAAAAAAVRRDLRGTRRAPSPASWRAALEREVHARLTRALVSAP